MEESQKTENKNYQKLEEELCEKAKDFENLKSSLGHEKQEKDKKQKDIEVLNEKLRGEALHYEDLKIQNAIKQCKMEEELKIQQDKAFAEKHELEAAMTKRSSEVEKIKQQLSFHKDQNAALIQQKKVIENEKQDLADLIENMKLKADRTEEQRKRVAIALADAEEQIVIEKRAKEEAVKSRRKLEGEYKQLMDQFELLTQSANNTAINYKRRETEISEWRNKTHEDANLITKLQINLRQLIARIEHLEDELEKAFHSKNRTERLRLETQAELDNLQTIVAETNGQLNVQMHLNKSRQKEVSDLHHELEKKNMSHETHIANLCSMQWLTLNNLKNLSQQAAFLENEANHVLDFRNATKNSNSVLLRSYTTKEFNKTELDDL